MFLECWSLKSAAIWLVEKTSSHMEKCRKILQNINAVVHSQTGKQRNELADRKQTFHRATILQTGPIKQAGVDCCWRGCFDGKPDTNPHPDFLGKSLNILMYSLHFLKSTPEFKLTYTSWTTQ